MTASAPVEVLLNDTTPSPPERAPAGELAKLRANIAALDTLRRIQDEQRAPTADERTILARWSAWGAIPRLFDEEHAPLAAARAQVRHLLGQDEAWAAARRTVLTAFYTPPVVVEAMWQTATALGITAGRVLEPGCGSGNFLAAAPAGLHLVGVEADPTTAAIAQHLHGDRARIHPVRFEAFHPKARFDLVIGNVPYGKVTPHDPEFNKAGHSLHNYFLIKGLRLLRPNGLLIALTSRWTLDAENSTARRELAHLAELVGAVRLPAGAFHEIAGTDVVCDLLVLRRRDGDDPPGADPEWLYALPSELPGQPRVSGYFKAHPEMVAGRLAVGRGLYRDAEVTVEPTGPLADILGARLATLIAKADSNGLRCTVPTPPHDAEQCAAEEAAPTDAEEGSFQITAGGRLSRVEDGMLKPYTPRVARDAAELRRLIELRNAARRVLGVQIDGAGDTAVAVAQQTLRAAYADYTSHHGPLNRYKLARTGRRDPETGEETNRRLRPSMGGFRDDPDWPLVSALEVFDDETQTAEPAPIFTQRVINPPEHRTSADTPADALAISLDETGRVSIERIAALLGTTLEQAYGSLEGLVYEDPESRDLVPAARYLSGNVRRKLEVARAAAADDARYVSNVHALEAAMPRQLEPGEIKARLGAPWIPARDVEAFVQDVLGAQADVEHLPSIARWTVSLRGWRATVALTSEWGTSRADAITLLEDSLNQRLHTVTDPDPETEGRRVRNEPETIAAREKQDALGERFSTWVWEDKDRAARLTTVYNELFSSVALTRHDGSHLTFPGLAATFVPHAHQRDAVARILTDGRALLAHAVGAGKTAVMAMAAMEMRRLGLVNKPAIVVPNHMLEQFAREFLQLYPRARLLLADGERVAKENRKRLVARCATGNWDAVIFTQSSFGQLPVGPAAQAGYLGAEIAHWREALSLSSSGKRLSVKRLERRLTILESRHEELLAAQHKDDGLHFGETGIDYLMVDEAHLFKNLRVVTSIEGMAHPGSQRSTDLDAKLWHLRRVYGQRVVTFATATPVSNSIAELWTMLHYLVPDLLLELGMHSFDAWAANFGRTVTALELAPDGSSYRLKARFARFQNVPELLVLYRQVADVCTADQLALAVPALLGGRPDTVVVPGSPQLRQYVHTLAERAEAIRNRLVTPEQDNMLRVCGDGRRAALDPRLVGLEPDPDGKLTRVADRVAAIHARHRHTAYLDPAGRRARRPGGFQLVFCDLSTPSAAWNAYHELRSLLVERGIPAQQVRFVHEAVSNDAKAKLFAACRDGRVAVLIGSTEKMGVGTNVQTRLVALHHVDAPWRPADLEQRDGRGRRQGNQNAAIDVVRYATEGSFDIYMWQTLERKAAFIAQITTGQLLDREVEDIGEQALSYAEVKALATGNPLIVDKAGVDAELAHLSRLARAHEDDQQRLRRVAVSAEQHREALLAAIETCAATVERRTDTSGDRFTMTVNGTRCAKRADAGQQLLAAGVAALRATRRGESRPPEAVGQLGGLSVLLATSKVIASEPYLRLLIGGTPIDVRYHEADWADRDPAALVQGLERRIQHLDDTLAELRAELDATEAEARHARARLGQPFEHEHRLAALRRRQQELAEALLATDNQDHRLAAAC